MWEDGTGKRERDAESRRGVERSTQRRSFRRLRAARARSPVDALSALTDIVRGRRSSASRLIFYVTSGKKHGREPLDLHVRSWTPYQPDANANRRPPTISSKTTVRYSSPSPTRCISSKRSTVTTATRNFSGTVSVSLKELRRRGSVGTTVSLLRRSCSPISWDEFFDEFEASDLALVYEEDSRFSKLVDRDSV